MTYIFFFELIQIALGNRSQLSHIPQEYEWQKIYDLAIENAVAGICFLGAKELQPFFTGKSEVLFWKWLSVVDQIQKRNEKMNRLNAELCNRLSSEGISCCILKGQGIAALYGERLCQFRQSGDIDVWALPKHSDSFSKHFKRIYQRLKAVTPILDFNKIHISISLYPDSETEEEIHITPSNANNPFLNHRLQHWFRVKAKAEDTVQKCSLGFPIPSIDFNVIYILQHCYHHLLFDGLGIRQLMDYYFVLKEFSSSIEADQESGQDRLANIQKDLQALGLKKFASAMMWTLTEVFAMDPQYHICRPNEKEGLFILKEILNGGMYGTFGNDELMDNYQKGKVTFFMARMKRGMRFLFHYPSEILWSPYSMISHYLWKRRKSKD